MNQKKVKTLLKALEFYAEERHFLRLTSVLIGGTQIHFGDDEIGQILDKGEKAREALKEYNESE